MDGESEKYDGYLYKIEHSMVGQSRKKFWFVLPFDSPTLYWFKNASDFQCAGRISLSGAAFTYNPRDHALFEIHVNNEIIQLEAPNNKLRAEWLRMLQVSRKRYYQHTFSSCDNDNVMGQKAMSGVVSTNVNDENMTATDGDKNEEKPSTEPSSDDCIEAIKPSQSTFYLSERGELNRNSLCLPEEPTVGCSSHIDELVSRAGAEMQNLADSPTKRIINKARESIRRLSEAKSNTAGGKECKSERCIENLEISNQLRNRCYELTDELVANQELISALKRSLVTAHNQRDALAKICERDATMEDKLGIILDCESLVTNLQCTVTDLRREVEYYKEENRALESENSSLNATIDAFKKSIRTKDELILKYYDTSNPVVTNSNVIQINRRDSISEEVPEAILFDASAEPDQDAKRVFSETSVNDVTEMKDLVDGYASQNKFLNNEVIELQQIVQSLEERERKLIRQNFDIEAIYYQLKSRYIMVLNHFRLSTHPNHFLDPALVHNLINEVASPSSTIRPGSPSIQTTHPDNLPSTSTNTANVIDPKSYAMLLSPYKNINYLSPSTMDAETDSLGFYLNSPRSRCQTPMAMMAIARLATSLPAANVTDETDDNEIRNDGGESRSASPNSEASESEAGPLEPATTTAAEIEEGTAKRASSPSQVPGSPFATSLSAVLAAKNPPDPAGDDWMVRVAAHLKKRSDDIRENIALANNRDYIEWLQKWDAFLVNHVLQPLPDPGLNSELKSLIRMGISHAYRSRIWKSLVFHYVGTTEAEMGKGYYECLLRKAENIREKFSDSALKQIDLDLGRTLPTNKQFDSENSEKTQALKRVLYAFRFHNRAVEYCQGLNRIAAIGLLYLSEADAFWFLVACVEHLQPPNYYDHNLLGAVVDQKILLSLVQKKLPTLWEHFRKLDVDLSLFTLNWFLTIFVDALTHNIYINIFDVFLYEGNKVLFRFALALLKVCEPRILECSSLTGVQACISNLSNLPIDYKTLADIAFKQMNPFPSRTIESRRQTYLAQFKSSDQQ